MKIVDILIEFGLFIFVVVLTEVRLTYPTKVVGKPQKKSKTFNRLEYYFFR